MDLSLDALRDVLSFEERAILRLRSLYRQFGYGQYKMSRFEEYGLYADNKPFLADSNIISFTGADGKLMAMRPDVTLSIVKNAGDVTPGDVKKLYYNENVYRPVGNEFREQMQTGLECIGSIDGSNTAEVLMLAGRSLRELGQKTRLDVSHMGFITALMQDAGIAQAQGTPLLRKISEKNVPELRCMCARLSVPDNFTEKLVTLASLYGHYRDTVGILRELCSGGTAEEALRELDDIFTGLRKLNADDDVFLDFSLINDLNYYSGVIFHGYIEGIPKKVLSGGRYDELLRKFGKSSGAVGFAVYLDFLEPGGSGRPEESDGNAARGAGEIINIALPKGRLGEKAYAIFENAGFGCPEIQQDSRKLVFESIGKKARYFWVKPSDVPIYVQRGVADIGVVGKDILLEHSPDVYELHDLGIGKCRMCVAAKEGFSPEDLDRPLRVATTFPNIARGYFTKRGRQIDIIKLSGSVELAPLLGLSDVIVDLVETGATLRENNLETTETIAHISARLVANKAGYKFKHDAITRLCGMIIQRDSFPRYPMGCGA